MTNTQSACSGRRLRAARVWRRGGRPAIHREGEFANLFLRIKKNKNKNKTRQNFSLLPRSRSFLGTFGNSRGRFLLWARRTSSKWSYKCLPPSRRNLICRTHIQRTYCPVHRKLAYSFSPTSSCRRSASIRPPRTTPRTARCRRSMGVPSTAERSAALRRRSMYLDLAVRLDNLENSQYSTVSVFDSLRDPERPSQYS